MWSIYHPSPDQTRPAGSRVLASCLQPAPPASSPCSPPSPPPPTGLSSASAALAPACPPSGHTVPLPALGIHKLTDPELPLPLVPLKAFLQAGLLEAQGGWPLNGTENLTGALDTLSGAPDIWRGSTTASKGTEQLQPCGF